MDHTQKQITVKLHYLRADGNYTGWNAWMWTLKQGGKQYELVKEGSEMVATVKVDGYTTGSVSFILRKGNWEEQEFNERRIDVSTVAAGTVHYYEVVLLETLPAGATEAMITSGFDLSLYTCTPGGANRVTVRCNTVRK